MAVEEKDKEKIEEIRPAPSKVEPKDQISVTRHRARINGKQVAYTVTCGTVVIKEEAEKEGKSEGERARAQVFFVAYTLDDVKDRAPRRSGCTWASSGRSAWPSTTTALPRRSPAASCPTSSRSSTSPTSCSSTRSAPASAAWSRARRWASTTSTSAISRAWGPSSAS